jgi:hypothetical protein
MIGKIMPHFTITYCGEAWGKCYLDNLEFDGNNVKVMYGDLL